MTRLLWWQHLRCSLRFLSVALITTFQNQRKFCAEDLNQEFLQWWLLYLDFFLPKWDSKTWRLIVFKMLDDLLLRDEHLCLLRVLCCKFSSVIHNFATFFYVILSQNNRHFRVKFPWSWAKFLLGDFGCLICFYFLQSSCRADNGLRCKTREKCSILGTPRFSWNKLNHNHRFQIHRPSGRICFQEKKVGLVSDGTRQKIKK